MIAKFRFYFKNYGVYFSAKWLSQKNNLGEFYLSLKTFINNNLFFRKTISM